MSPPPRGGGRASRRIKEVEMTLTADVLTRAAGVAAVTAGVIFVGVQI